MKFLILIQQQADDVSSRPTLRPRQVGDLWILPLAVLTDPVQSAEWPLLQTLPQQEVELPVEDDQ